MTQLGAEGFATYGSQQAGNTYQESSQALAAGAWAEASFIYISRGLPWTTAEDTVYWAKSSGFQGALRRVLSTTQNELVVAFRMALSNLPVENGSAKSIDIRNGANQILYYLTIQSTGVLALYNSSNTIVGQTQSPIIVAQAAHRYEFKINISAGTFKLFVDGEPGDAPVLDLSGLTTGNAGPIAQFYVMNTKIAGVPLADSYMTDLIWRSTTGTYNNDIVGDRRVATLMVNSDDLAHQGWTPRPIQRFGTGVLACPTGTGALTCATTTDTDFGSGDFTVEGQVRFSALPTGSNLATLFGKWSSSNNQRSWRLYKSGPTLDSGMLTFQCSTNGTSGGVVTVLRWPWEPDLDRWYHVALSRVSGQLRLFIDGVLQGLPITDANAYFAGASKTALMGQVDNTSYVNNASMAGWADEFRITKGVGRYTANFAAPTGPFPRGGTDPNWANVVWLSGFDAGILDESSFARTLTIYYTVTTPVRAQPGDLVGAYMTINKIGPPYDYSFIEAALVPATSLYTLVTNPVVIPDNQWLSVCWSGSLFVAVASTGTGNRVMTSPDGINWTARTSAADNTWLSVCWSGSLFVAVATSGTGNRVMTSPDGINWTIRTSAADNAWWSVCWSGSLFVAVANTGTGNRVMTSPDGINWTIRTSAADNTWRSVCWSGSLFVAVASTGTGNRVMTSPDGINWTIRTSAADNAWRSVCWSGSLFVAVASGGTGNRVMTSPDGINWTIRTSAADNAWYSVSWSPALGLLCAVANTGTGNRVMTSPDGINWTLRTSAADNDWYSVAWSAELGLFCAVAGTGTGNRVMTSSDGMSWAITVGAGTVRVGTKDGTNSALYTYKAALTSPYDVLIGADATATLNNLVAAINKGSGEGTVYGTGTLVNWDVSAEKMPTTQVLVRANTAGAVGNSIATTATAGSWPGATLSGGADIPPYSQFGFSRPPNDTTVIDSITLVQKVWKTDSGPASFVQSFVAPAGAVGAGAAHAVTTSPTLYFDLFETDPDTGAPPTPTTLLNGKVRVNRTV